MAIPGDAVPKFYGDKAPEAGNNILGWSPRIAEDIRTAVATGGDVQIPLADWLARVDPEVAKELHDDIRVRPGGITKNEKLLETEAKEEIKAAGDLQEELANLREANSPLFDEREAAGKAGDEARVVELTAKMQASDNGADEWQEIL